MGILAKAYLRYPALRDAVKRLRPGRLERAKKALGRSGLMPSGANLDYARSRVVPSDFGLQLWINSTPDFQHGIVPASEKESVVEELTKFLLADCDPKTGRRIVKAVHRAGDLYSGDYVDDAPDLIIEYDNTFRFGAESKGANSGGEGGHTPEGILLMGGPGIRACNLPGASLPDLAPTILHLQGESVPSDMDGRVLMEALTESQSRPGSADYGPSAERARNESGSETDGYSSEERKQIEEQLRRLGYL